MREIGGWLQERLQFIHASSLTALVLILPRARQVVYLDPMFPHKQKSALVKRCVSSVAGGSLVFDADRLLEPARLLATKRVVVKRPDYAPPPGDMSPRPNAVVTKGQSALISYAEYASVKLNQGSDNATLLSARII